MRDAETCSATTCRASRLTVCNLAALTFTGLSHGLLVGQLHIPLQIARQLHEHNVLQNRGMEARQHRPTLRYGRTRGRHARSAAKWDGVLAAISPTLAVVSRSTACTSSLHTSACMGETDRWDVCSKRSSNHAGQVNSFTANQVVNTASQHAYQLQPLYLQLAAAEL